MKYIIANWKSHKSREEVEKWLDGYQEKLINVGENQVVIAPPMPALMFVSNRLLQPELRHTKLGVQDLSPFPAGAYTGAVSARNLEGFKVSYAILGHSERRRYFHETHQEVANKVDQALSAGIKPIVCVDDEYITEQAAAIPAEQRSKCLVAYEDLAAIGTGKNTDLKQVQENFSVIRDAFGQVPLIYGGSVNSSNVSEYLAHCDGVLVGTASLDVDDFLAVVHAALE